MPHTLSDVLVVLKPDRARDLAAIEDDMRERLERLPGVAVLFTTPLGMRIDEGLGGTPADLSVRIFGPDLDELARLAEQAERIMARCRGPQRPPRRAADRPAAAADRRRPARPRRASAWRRVT